MREFSISVHRRDSNLARPERSNPGFCCFQCSVFSRVTAHLSFLQGSLPVTSGLGRSRRESGPVLQYYMVGADTGSGWVRRAGMRNLGFHDNLLCARLCQGCSLPSSAPSAQGLPGNHRWSQYWEPGLTTSTFMFFSPKHWFCGPGKFCLLSCYHIYLVF